MKHTSFPALLGALALAAPIAAALPLPAPSAAAAQSQEQRAEFLADLDRALAIEAKAEIEKLVRTRTGAAVEVVRSLAESEARSSNAENRARLEALDDAWRATVGTSFVDDSEVFFLALTPEQWKRRADLERRASRLRKAYHEQLAAERDPERLDALGEELGDLARALAELGDHWLASQAWLSAAVCYEEQARGKDGVVGAVREAARDAYAACVAERERAGVLDRVHQQSALRRDYLQAEIDAPPSTEAELEAARPPATGPTVALEPTFERLESIDDFERPDYALDDVFALWRSIYLDDGEQRTTTFALLGPDSPTVHRVAATDLRVDVEGDGIDLEDEEDEPDDVLLPLTGNRFPLQFPIGEGPARREWAVFVQPGSKLLYQSIELNFEPTSEQVSLYFVNAGSQLADVAGTSVRILDDNLDGVYGSPPLMRWSYGVDGDGEIPSFDAVVIGSGKRAVPWSEYQRVGRTWVRFERTPSGGLTATPVELETGKLKLKFADGDPDWVVVRGAGIFADSYFDLADGTVEVPAGTWRLSYGLLHQGKALRVQKAVILPGAETPEWEVEPGRTTTVELGGPFAFEFRFEDDPQTFHVDGQSVAVRGRAGERYAMTWNCVPRPEVAYRKVGARKASGRPERMTPCWDTGQLAANSPPDRHLHAAWYPLDYVGEKSKSEPEVEVRLVEEDNELFGEIASEWTAASPPAPAAEPPQK